MEEQQYLLTVKDPDVYRNIGIDVDCENAEAAYEKIAEITWIANESLVSILQRNDEAKTIIIEIKADADLTKATSIEKVPDGEQTPGFNSPDMITRKGGE